MTRNPINPRAIRPFIPLPIFLGKSTYDPNAPYYLQSLETVEMTIEEFAQDINSTKDGELYMIGGKFIKFSKKTRTISYPAILMTNVVYNGFKNENRTRNDVVNNLWKEQNHKIKNISGKIFGSDLQWKIE